jgi:hypothetical protein
MPITRDDVLAAALQLSDDDRLLVATQLLETLPDELPGLDLDAAALSAELQRRSGDWNGAVAWDELKREVDCSR